MEIAAILFMCFTIVGFILWAVGVISKTPFAAGWGAIICAVGMCGALAFSAAIAFMVESILIGSLCVIQALVGTPFWILQATIAFGND